ncbi:hypothetical protein Q9R32_10310 [Actinotalea sp. AC32]|nr:hypothetical protein [Actinotalea sp. AC32]
MVSSRPEGARQVALQTPASAGRARPDVAEQLDALLGEHLLPLRARTPGRDDEPHLLAVDASGQPVVVEVVGLLDEEACLRALRHAGRAARLTGDELAALYSAGPERFATHLEAFRRTVPATELLTPSLRWGARLLLVCSAIAPGVVDVLEFLLQRGHQVEVLQVRVTEGPGGGRLVDVVPVGRSAVSREQPQLQPVPRRPRDRREPAPERPRPVVVPPPFAVPVGASGVRGTTSGGIPLQQPPVDAPVTDPYDDEPAPDLVLADLAARLGEVTRLVWARARRGEVHEALLHPDGVVELADGRCFADLHSATYAAGGVAVDGWRVWRAGHECGPTLAELVDPSLGR